MDKTHTGLDALDVIPFPLGTGTGRHDLRVPLRARTGQSYVPYNGNDKELARLKTCVEQPSCSRGVKSPDV